MKLALRIEDLAVDSFEAAPAPSATRGTIHANASDPDTCAPVLCASGEWTCLDTCLDTCQDTCGMSCNGTCIPEHCAGGDS